MNDEDKLREKLEQANNQNINLRFDNVEKELNEIKSLLKEYFTEIRTNREEALAIAKLLDERVTKLEECQRHCSIRVVKTELGRYSRETSFIRGIFKNPWKGVIITSIWVIIIITLVMVLGPTALFEGLIKLKGM